MAVLSSVIGRGTLAGRPAAGNAGRLYFATDSPGTMYRDNGSSWDSVETSGGLADQGTATYLDFSEAAAPGTPASGKVRLYAKTDGSLYQKDDAGTETGLAGGGGSGASWTEGINESGASFANFTANSGTWASNGTEITQTDTAASTRRARHNTLVPMGFGVIVETEAFFVTTGTGNIRAGLLIGDPADAGHLWVYLERLASGAGNQQVAVERESVVQVRTYTGLTINDSTWYKLRVVFTGVTISTYFAGTLLGTTMMTPREDEIYPQLGSYAASVKFRNFKVWTLSGGAPA